ncbi:MAG TPA: N-6 DNA methylase [Flavipsychrobacter sp.]|nr:N-6 DNA methylase [Flavipsychrobacter sp.]
MQRTNLIKDYLHKVKTASKEATKKEAFKDLLNRLYHGEKEIERIIDKISSGSEYSILNIPRKDKLHKGSADTLYNQIIIEFENNLKTTEKHAKEQLAGYLLGQFKSGMGYNFTLIASDCIHWKVYAPDVSQLDQLDAIKEHELKLVEVPSASFTLNENNAEDFYYWIDRFLFKEEKQKATLKAIEEAFGYQSATFIESYRIISNVFNQAKKSGEVQVSYEQWRKFLSIAYGSFQDTESKFIIHTYLSFLAKALAYEVLSNDDYIDDAEMKSVLEGTVFHKYNIRNFVDNDFFHWIKTDGNYHKLKKAFRLIAQEISTFDFEDVAEDILKGVYQELIDLDTRHALGEYYTPDWLCERVVGEFDFKAGEKILDPSCGSGSFLRAAVHRIKKLNPDAKPEQIAQDVYGIDIHPLSVQIAKTTLLLALGKDIGKAKKPVHINVILANSLLQPLEETQGQLHGADFRMDIDKYKFYINTKVLEDVTLYNDAVQICDELAEQTMNRDKDSPQTLLNTLKNRNAAHSSTNKQQLESFYSIYEYMKLVKERGRNSIWKFILQNQYKPYFLAGKFDYIIGNPPWFTYSSIRNEEYQNILNTVAVSHQVKPARVANFPHLEIAAIFLSYCTSYYLSEEGKLAFVLPRSFFSADHHENTRSGNALGFKLKAAWDLDKVQPLFRVPSCVLFAEKAKKSKNDKQESVKDKAIPATGIKGLFFSGRLPAHNCSYEDAQPNLTEEKLKWYYVQQGKSSALSSVKKKSNNKINPYKAEFKQGATIVPRSFYFVELTQEEPEDWDDRIINIKTAEAIKPDAKVPWRDINFRGQIESQYLFRTALSKSILPFALYKPDLVVLPIEITVDENGNKKIELLAADEIRKKGHTKASKWFMDAENVWNIHKTEKNAKISSEDYLNWQNKLISQNLNAKYVVLYNASAKDANAVVVRRNKIDLDFLIESVCYAFYTNKQDEAFYLTAILNSNVPNELMKDFQAKGLFGARHVHKKILDIYYPRYDKNDPLHNRLAALSEQAHKKTARYLKDNHPQQALTAMHLGRLRVAIKKHLAEEMKEIDKMVAKVVG